MPVHPSRSFLLSALDKPLVIHMKKSPLINPELFYDSITASVSQSERRVKQAETHIKPSFESCKNSPGAASISHSRFC